MASRHPLFRKFIDDLRAAWAAEGDTEAHMQRATELLTEFVSNPDLRAMSKDWPCTDGHKNLLLYEDPDYGFVINAVVRMSGRKGGIHDHAVAWTAYGVLDGVESLERYARVEDRSSEGHVEIRLDSVTEGTPGTVDLVPPYDIHRECAGPARSVAVIVRSERLVGRYLQGRYNIETFAYHQGEGPTQVPFELEAETV